MLQLCTHICEQQIQCRDRSHTFDDNDRARNDDRIMASLDGELHRLTGAVDRLLRLADRGGRLDGNTEYNGRAVTDAAERTAGVIGRFCDAAVRQDKRIVVGAASRGGSGKAVADLKAFDAADREHRLGEICVQLIKHGITDACGHTMIPPHES